MASLAFRVLKDLDTASCGEPQDAPMRPKPLIATLSCLAWVTCLEPLEPCTAAQDACVMPEVPERTRQPSPISHRDSSDTCGKTSVSLLA